MIGAKPFGDIRFDLIVNKFEGKIVEYVLLHTYCRKTVRSKEFKLI